MQTDASSANSFKKIRFVADSTCDLPPDLVERYRIGVIPCFINQGEDSYADDGRQLVRDDFYRQLPGMRPYPTTSAMSPGLAKKIIEQTFEGADHLIILSVSSKLSGVINVLRLGMADLPPERVTLLDSLSLTMGLGWQVLLGAETAEQTGDLVQVLDIIAQVRDSQRIYFALDTLEFLRRGGRVSWTAASMGSLLQIKPIIAVLDGEVKSISRVRTYARALDEIVRLAHARAPLERLALLYAKDPEPAHLLYERLRDIAPAYAPLMISVTPTIGVHTGPGGIGICTVSAIRRE